MIPAWKLVREVRRVKDQIIGLPHWLYTLPARLREPAMRKDWLENFDLYTRQTKGQIARCDKIAIFLIYQPNGIAPSVIHTIEWLRDHGFASFIVSNTPIRESDLQQLREISWHVLERQNFGYDFGGYQDAIRLINQMGCDPKRLIIMNDSVWNPMSEGLMERLENRLNAGADICGLLRNEKVIHNTRGGTPVPELFHVESYFYMISHKAWQSDAFQEFWRNYEMTDSKPNTIKFGELGFSRRMDEAGIILDALTQRSTFVTEITSKDDTFLQQTLKYAAYADQDLKIEAEKLIRASGSISHWRLQALEHIRKTANRKRFNASYPFATQMIFGTYFMKKSQEPIFIEMRRQYLRAIDESAIPAPHPIILEELRQSVGSHQ